MISFNCWAQLSSIQNGLVIQYNFEGNTDDSSGNNFHAVSNATLTTDRFGNANSAYSFNGIDEFIDLPNDPKLKPNLPVTVSFWVYFDDLNVENSFIFTTDFAQNVHSGLSASLTSSSPRIAVAYGDNGSATVNSRRTKVGTTIIKEKTWYSVIVIIRDALDMDLYVSEFNTGNLCANDGGTYSGNGSNLSYTTNAGSLGRSDASNADNPYYFKGKIDEFKMWDRALTTSEILDVCETNKNAAANTPPELSATGNQAYCPLSSIPIVETFNLTSGTSQIDAIFIQISVGYNNGSDKLRLTGNHPNITPKLFNSLEGKLELEWTGSGSPNDAELIAALKEVVFESTSINVTNKEFSITISETNYLPSTDHYYEYVPSVGITWTEAKTAAEGRNYYGLQGYLVTITSTDEAQLSGEQAPGTGWIGGSDAASEGTWRWMTGPEAGNSFWIGDGNGTTAGTDNPFAFWNPITNPKEPNNAGNNEHYAHIVSPNLVNASPTRAISGSWNDLTNTGSTSGDYQPKGYIVEYGGMDGDPILNISASTKIYIPEIETTTPNSNCGTGTVNLSATATSGDMLWFDVPTGGTPIFTGTNFTTPSISTTTDFFALASENGCETGIRTSVTATIYTIPTIITAPDETICGAGTGTLTATASAGEINWYTSPTSGTSLETGNSYSPTISTTTTYYVDATENGCTTLTRTPVTLNVQYTNPPTATSPQTFCDIENATLAELSITGTAILWYAAPSGGIPLSNSEILVNNTTYYASQTENTCESPTRLPVNVLVYETVTALPPADIPIIEACDSTDSGSDTDGFTIFDLTENESVLLNGKNASDFIFRYFTDPNHLISSEITTPSSFVNTAVNGQPIYVSIANNLDNSCKTDTSFEIQTNSLPVIQYTVTLKNCDEDGLPDGNTDFNLTEADPFITNGDTSLSVTYYLTFSEADNGSTAPVNPSPFNNQDADNDEVFARVENSFGCHRVSTVSLEVSTTHFPPNYMFDLETCDADGTIDGFETFDLSQASTDITNQFPTGQNLSVHYFRNLNDAQLKENEILPQETYINEIPYLQILYVRVQSEDNGDCFGIGAHLTLTVFPRPEFELTPSEIVCLNLPPITLAPFNEQGIYTYEWFNEAGISIGINPTIAISTGGIYTAIATSGSGCESFPQTVIVTESIIATVTQNDISVTDDSNNNSITINTSNLGIGEYEFSLNEMYGPYQDEPIFEMVKPGVHTIYIQDKNNCGTAAIDVSVIGYPNFFTPNNDGFNDTWKVLGVSNNFYPTSLIYIFDRFGKLITTVDPTSDGWNGLYNNELLPATDYWFTAQLIDENGNIREKKGHFSLIR